MHFQMKPTKPFQPHGAWPVMAWASRQPNSLTRRSASSMKVYDRALPNALGQFALASRSMRVNKEVPTDNAMNATVQPCGPGNEQSLSGADACGNDHSAESSAAQEPRLRG